MSKIEAEELIGKEYGRLTVLSEMVERSGSNGEHKLMCRCQCGERVGVRRSNLLNGKTKSCGCLRSELASAHRRRSRKIHLWSEQ